MIIGASYADPNGIINAGASYVVFGGAGVGAGGNLDLSTLNGTNGFKLSGVAFDDRSGHSVSNAGDINGDGTDDVIIGAYFADPDDLAAFSNAGVSYVVFGGPGAGAGGNLELSTLNGTNGFKLSGVTPGDISGFSVSNAGDVNNDGVDDVIIGANGADTNCCQNAGASYVVFGEAPPPPTTTTLPPTTTTTTTLPPTTTTTVPPGFTCNGLPATIVGTNASETIFGTAGPDVIHGLGGNDLIRGLAGDDVICGGSGKDQLFGDQNKDKLFGQNGDDAMDGGGASDFCSGGPGTDKAVNCESTTDVP